MNTKLSLEWLGINGFRFCYNGKVVLLDPWVTRNNSEVCNKGTVAKYIPEADYIFIGHSHWDHLADAAEIHFQTNAIIIGSQTTLNICRAQGVPESHLRLFDAGDTLDFGDFKVDVYASVHKLPMLYPGTYDTVPEKIETIEDFLEGGTFALRFHFGDMKVLNVGSANFLKEEFNEVDCDYLLAGIAGRTDSYTQGLVEVLSPQCVIPTHFDGFETPLEENSIRTDVESYRRDVCKLFPEVKVIVPVPLEKIEI